MKNRSWFEFDSLSKPIHWECPSCSSGVLCIDDQKSIEQISLWREEISDPLDYLGIFTWEMKCSNCSFKIFTTGDEFYDFNYEAPEFCDFSKKYYKLYRVKYFSTSPQIISIPDDTDDYIKDMLLKSFHLFWVDVDACGNKIRQLLELVMDANGIKKETTKGYTIPLHKRISQFMDERNFSSKRLLALKDLGNIGSHSGDGLTKSSVLDAFEILESVVYEWYTIPKVERMASGLK